MPTDTIIVWTKHESSEAMALEAASNVNTSTIVAYIWDPKTFIDINTRVPCVDKCVTHLALALETTFQVKTFSVRTNTYAHSVFAFIDICKEQEKVKNQEINSRFVT